MLKRTNWKKKNVKIGGQSYSYACAILQLEKSPSGKTMNIFFKFIIFEQSFDKFSFSGCELCWRIGGVCFSSGGWSIIRTAAGSWDRKKRAAAETARQNVVRKQPNSIIRPAPRVCTQKKCLSVWKVSNNYSWILPWKQVSVFGIHIQCSRRNTEVERYDTWQNST